MRPRGAVLGLIVLAGCSSPSPVSVVGRWQAYLGDGDASKLYYGKPEPTQIDFKDDGTYTIHMMWGAQSIAETGGNYEVLDGKIRLSPWEKLDPGTWPGSAELTLTPDHRTFTLPLPTSARFPEAQFFRLRD